MHQYCNRSYRCRNRPYWYTVTAHIRTVTTQIGTQTIERLCAKSICISLCNHRHISSVLQFFLPKKPEPIHYLRAMQSSNSFSLINFFCKGSFSLVNLWNISQLITSGVKTDAFTWLLLSDLFRTYLDRLVGLVVRRPPRERKIPGSNPACARIFSGSSHTSDSKIGTPVATLPGAWHYRFSAGTGRPGVSILWLGEVESLICNFSLSVAAPKIVWADPSLRYTVMLLGC